MRTLWKNVFGSLQKTVFTMILVLIAVPTTPLGMVSYGRYREIITVNTRTLNLSNTSQIASNIGGVLKDIRNGSLSFYQNDMVRSYLLAKKPRQVEDAWYSLDQYTLDQLAYEGYIYIVGFVRMDGQQYSFSSIAEGISKGVRGILLAKDEGAVFRTDVHMADYGGLKSDELYNYARYTHDISDTGMPIGLQQVYLKKQELLGLLDSYRADGEEYCIVENGDVIISTDEEAVGIPVTSVFPKLDLSEEYPSQRMEMDGAMAMTTCAGVKYSRWYMVKQISLSEMNEETAVAHQLLVSVGILAVVLCAMAGFFLSRFVIRLLEELESSIKHIEEDNFKRKLSEEGYQEFSLLAKAFNRMGVRPDELVNQVYLAEIRGEDTRIRAVQAYISPHFLYSTLDAIYWMGRMEQTGEAYKLIKVLSKLFRASMKDTGGTTAVATELEHVRNYIMMQECRRIDSIEFKTETAGEVMNCGTVRFVLQPLVENVIVHGLESMGERGTIWIKIYGEQGRLIMSVEDDGLDADVKELEGLLAQYQEGLRGMGLSNVNDRIRLYYGEGYGIQFEQKEPKGLIIWVIQPLVAEEGQKEGGQYD